MPKGTIHHYAFSHNLIRSVRMIAVPRRYLCGGWFLLFYVLVLNVFAVCALCAFHILVKFG